MESAFPSALTPQPPRGPGPAFVFSKMASAIVSSLSTHPAVLRGPRVTQEPAWVRWVLVGTALVFLAFFLVLPLAAVFAEAFRRGVGAYFASFADPDALASIKPTSKLQIPSPSRAADLTLT